MTINIIDNDPEKHYAEIDVGEKPIRTSFYKLSKHTQEILKNWCAPNKHNSLDVYRYLQIKDFDRK